MSVEDALDVLHVTGQSDEGGGYLQLRDNKQLRDEARRLILEGICEDNAFDLLRRADAMGQQEAKKVIVERLLRPGCCPDLSGRVGDEVWCQGEGGWWSKDQEIVMLRAVLSQINSSRAEEAARRVMDA